MVKRAEIDAGQRPGTATADEQRLVEVERENPEPVERDSGQRVGILRGGARPPTTVIVDYIDEHRSKFGVEPICRELQVAPSTYYAAKARPPSARSVADAELIEVIAAEHAAKYGVDGGGRCGSTCTARDDRSGATGSSG